MFSGIHGHKLILGRFANDSFDFGHRVYLGTWVVVSNFGHKLYLGTLMDILFSLDLWIYSGRRVDALDFGFRVNLGKLDRMPLFGNGLYLGGCVGMLDSGCRVNLDGWVGMISPG